MVKLISNLDSRGLQKMNEGLDKYAVNEVFQHDGHHSCWAETLRQG